jgi:hypothetical protein
VVGYESLAKHRVISVAVELGVATGDGRGERLCGIGQEIMDLIFEPVRVALD